MLINRPVSLLLAVVLLTSNGSLAGASEGDEPGLAALMAQLQVYTHKLDLSAQAGNEQLVAFYLHELEELTEEIVEGVPEYDGHAIGDLTAAMLAPVIDGIEDALQDGSGDAAMDKLVDACNACHRATEHGYIVIKRTNANPFNQVFSTDDT